MFKKKGGGKKLNIEEEVQQLGEGNQQQAEVKPNSSPVRMGALRGQKKRNMMSWQAMDEADQTRKVVVGSSGEAREKKIEMDDVEECFKQLRQQRKEWEEQHNQPQPQPESTVGQSHGNMIIQDNQEEERQDEYVDVLDIEEDLQGGFSPVRDPEDEHHIDLEEQLIRRTLTRTNYEKVAQKTGLSLHESYQAQAKDKLYKKTMQSSAKNIERTIARDLHLKKEKLRSVESKLGQMNQMGREERSVLGRKEAKLERMREEMERVKKVIEYLYYRGDRVQQFSVEAIFEQATTEAE